MSDKATQDDLAADEYVGYLASMTVSLKRAIKACGATEAGRRLRKQLKELRVALQSLDKAHELYELKIVVGRAQPAPGADGRHFVVALSSALPLRDQRMADKFYELLEKHLQQLLQGDIKERIELQTLVPHIEPASSSGAGEEEFDSGSDECKWAIKKINADQTWQQYGYGAGVRVAHPDSGYRQHSQLNNVDEFSDFDFYDGGSALEDHDPDDDDGMHGLATGSVIVSHHDEPQAAGEKVVYGVAPHATLVPLRVVEKRSGVPTPVLWSYWRLASAIDWAVSHDCDVVSMSLGGPGLPFVGHSALRNAVERARNQGLILCAAAGNFTQNVKVYPAAFDDVIACAASNASDRIWRGSAWGSHVDFVAPGQDVWRATFAGYDSDTDITRQEKVTRSSGTSYAVAHVAGIAALWLSHHGGRRALLRRAASAGFPRRAVGDAFYNALKSSASYDKLTVSSNKYGHGLVDARKTLQAPIDFTKPNE